MTASFPDTDPQRQDLLERSKGIRVTDWHDAMDALGLFERGLMGPDVRPLWRDTENFTHCVVGFAYTVRYVPVGRPIFAENAEDFAFVDGEVYAVDGAEIAERLNQLSRTNDRGHGYSKRRGGTC